MALNANNTILPHGTTSKINAAATNLSSGQSGGGGSGSDFMSGEAAPPHVVRSGKIPSGEDRIDVQGKHERMQPQAHAASTIKHKFRDL